MKPPSWNDFGDEKFRQISEKRFRFAKTKKESSQLQRSAFDCTYILVNAYLCMCTNLYLFVWASACLRGHKAIMKPFLVKLKLFQFVYVSPCQCTIGCAHVCVWLSNLSSKIIYIFSCGTFFLTKDKLMFSGSRRESAKVSMQSRQREE